MEVPTDEQYIEQAKNLIKKLNKRIEVITRERDELSKTVQAIIRDAKALVKLCPFCGTPINPFTDKTSIRWLETSRTFRCVGCKRVFSVVLRRKKVS